MIDIEPGQGDRSSLLLRYAKVPGRRVEQADQFAHRGRVVRAGLGRPPPATGTYHLRVSGPAGGTYSLVVARQANLALDGRYLSPTIYPTR